MKTLLYLANLRIPTEKGYGVQISKMCEAFADSISRVTLLAPFRKNPIKESVYEYYNVRRNFKVKKIWAPDFYFPGKLDWAAFHIKNFISATILGFYALFHSVDIIYSRDELLLFLLSFFKNNLVFEAHKFSNAKTIFYKRFLKKDVKIVAISESLKSKFLNLGFKINHVLVAHDGADLNDFDITISKEEARKKIGLSENVKIVMYTGHLFKWKGADILLGATKLISNDQFLTSKNIVFVFIGGTDHDVKEFREKAKWLDNVLILGHKPHKEIPLCLKAADVLILPNSAKDKIYLDTSPIKLFEYMAAGRPIVASTLPSITEILNEKNAVLVKSDDPESLEEGIKNVLSNDVLSIEIAKNARADAENYTWQKRAEKILNFTKSSPDLATTQ